MKRKKKRNDKEKKIAVERIKKLFGLADDIFNEDKKLANRYVEIARKIAMRYNVRIPKELKRRFCKYCYSYLKPGINCVVRVGKKEIRYHCLECGRIMRFPISNK